MVDLERRSGVADAVRSRAVSSAAKWDNPESTIEGTSWPSHYERSALVATGHAGPPGNRIGQSIGNPEGRIFDIVFATVALTLTLPVGLILAIIIRLTSRGPVFFKHRRIGQGGIEFDCFKFRTMCLDAEQVLERLLDQKPELRAEFEACHKLKDDPRTTRIGRLLRRLSLDELPQFWNVLRGEMSVVGPRPIVEEERGKYGLDLGLVLSVRPGLTGLWQISGRNDVEYRERVALDRTYVQTRSHILDLKIIAKTIGVMARRENGAY